MTVFRIMSTNSGIRVPIRSCRSVVTCDMVTGFGIMSEGIRIMSISGDSILLYMYLVCISVSVIR